MGCGTVAAYLPPHVLGSSTLENALVRLQRSGKGLPSYTSPEKANPFADREFSQKLRRNYVIADSVEKRQFSKKRVRKNKDLTPLNLPKTPFFNRIMLTPFGVVQYALLRQKAHAIRRLRSRVKSAKLDVVLLNLDAPLRPP